MEIAVLSLFRAGNYALIAVGFALVFGSLRVLNLMHGTYVMLGAYGAHLYIQALSGSGTGGAGPLQVAAGVLLSAATTAFVGWVFFRALQITRRTDPANVLAISVAGNLLVAQLIQYFFGTEGLNVSPIIEGSTSVAGVTVPGNDVLIPIVAVMAMLGLWFWLGRTRSGRALRAVADDPKAARLVGIPSDRVLAGSVGVAAFLAGLAGAITAPSLALSPNMWIHPLLVSFAVVVFGGRGSIWGALAGAGVLATAETATSWVWSEAAAQYVALLIIVLGLSLFPTGLSGSARHEVR